MCSKPYGCAAFDARQGVVNYKHPSTLTRLLSQSTDIDTGDRGPVERCHKTCIRWSLNCFGRNLSSRERDKPRLSRSP